MKIGPITIQNSSEKAPGKPQLSGRGKSPETPVAGDTFSKSGPAALTGSWKAADGLTKTLLTGAGFGSGAVGGLAIGSGISGAGSMISGLTSGTLSLGSIAAAGLTGGTIMAIIFGAAGAIAGYKLAGTAVKALHSLCTSQQAQKISSSAASMVKDTITPGAEKFDFPTFAPGCFPTYPKGQEPEITPREMKMLDMIKKQEFKKAFTSGDCALGAGAALVPAMCTAMYLSGNPVLAVVGGAGVIGAGWLLAGAIVGKNNAGEAEEEWGEAFADAAEKESISEVIRQYPQIGYKMQAA